MRSTAVLLLLLLLAASCSAGALVCSCSLLVDTSNLTTEGGANGEGGATEGGPGGGLDGGDASGSIDGGGLKPMLPPPTAWRTIAKGPPGRHSARMAYDAKRERVVLFGGGGFDDTWEWDGKTWQERTFGGGAATPSTRQGFGFAFDADRNVTVLFGGHGGSALWELDGVGWKRAADQANIPQRIAGIAMAYDARNKRTVGFGGYSDRALRDTWTVDGSGAARSTPAQSAVGLRGYGIAFDAARQRIVMFGGRPETSDNELSDETWLFDGTAWTKAASSSTSGGPGGRAGLCMTYDSDRQLVIMFGGRNLSTTFDDTWLWNGTAWSIGPSGGPGARRSCSMAYSEAQKATILFGGTLNDERKGLDDVWLLE